MQKEQKERKYETRIISRSDAHARHMSHRNHSTTLVVIVGELAKRMAKVV